MFVDWLSCSSPSKDQGSRRRKNKLRAGSTTTTQTFELHDLLNGSTAPTTVASTLPSSHGKPDASKNEKAEPHPDKMTTSIPAERIEVIQFNNITADEDNGGLVASADLTHGMLTTKSSSQRRTSDKDIKETSRRKLVVVSSASMLSSPLSTLSSSSLLPPDIITTSEDASTATTTTILTTSPSIIRSAASSRANVTGVLTVFTQPCPPEHAEDCVSSTVASSAGRGTVVDAAPNSHSESSASPSGLTQQPASSSSSRSAGVVGGTAAALVRAACAPCDVRQCQQVFPESCQGQILKDSCGCCPICSSYEDAAAGMLTTPVASGVGSASNASVCDSIRCPRGRICLLNIQGLPMCRCPSVFHCRRLPERPVCSMDGRTFKNRCFLGVEECASARTLSIAQDGRCNAEVVMTSPIPRQQSTLAPPTSAFRIHVQQPQILMSDERIRHQGYRVHNGIERNRQRPHRRQKQTRKHERQPLPDVAANDKRRPSAQAKRKSQGQRNSD